MDIIIFSGTKPIAEYLGTSLRREYIYAASQLLVRLDTSGGTTTTTYSHPDHLSARLETNTSGVVTRNFGHLPFGDIWYETGTIEKFKFTSYERDTESNLDYATFRFSSSRLGRFMSADPVAGSTGDPQSLNRYAYVLNNPANLTDPLGLSVWFNCLLDAEGRCIGSGSIIGGGGILSLGGGVGGAAFGSVGWVFQDSWNIFNAWAGGGSSAFYNSIYGDGVLKRSFGDNYFNLPGKGNPIAEGLWMYLFGEDGPRPATDPWKEIADLRLIPKQDFCRGGDRTIRYVLRRVSGAKEFLPNGQWWITEHHSVEGLNAGGSQGGNEFLDLISQAGMTNPINSIQTFTISLQNPATSQVPVQSSPVTVRIDGQDFGSLGIWISKNPLRNGQQSPDRIDCPPGSN